MRAENTSTTPRRRPRRSRRELDTADVCAALENSRGKVPPGLAEAVKELQQLIHTTLVAMATRAPETSLAVLLMGIEQARHDVHQIVRQLAAEVRS